MAKFSDYKEATAIYKADKAAWKAFVSEAFARRQEISADWESSYGEGEWWRYDNDPEDWSERICTIGSAEAVKQAWIVGSDDKRVKFKGTAKLAGGAGYDYIVFDLVNDDEPETVAMFECEDGERVVAFIAFYDRNGENIGPFPPRRPARCSC